MKRFLVFLLVFSTIFLLSCSKQTNEVLIDELLIVTNNSDNVMKAFSISNNEKNEIKIEGYCELESVIKYNDTLYCFGQKDNKKYILKQNVELKAIEIPETLSSSYDICIYNDEPIFMGKDLKFYMADFTNNKILYLFDPGYDDCSPNYYFTVENNIVLYYAIQGVDINSNVLSAGEIVYFNGVMNRIDSGILPMEYKKGIIYTIIKDNNFITKTFDFSNNTSQYTNISYLSSIVERSFQNNDKLLNINNEIIVYCDEYNMYYWKFSECKEKRIMHLDEEIFISFNKNY